MKHQKLIDTVYSNRETIYLDPDSILKKYDDYLISKGIFRSCDIVSFRKKIKGHIEFCDFLLDLYYEAKLDNERIMLLEDLNAIGYDSNKLVELILKSFDETHYPNNLWEYGDLLYSIKNFNFLTQYLSIISNNVFGEDRQMIVLLVGKSKNTIVIDTLKSLLNDTTVFGHALEALGNFSGNEICEIMSKFKNCNVKWIQNIAINYLKKNIHK